MQGKSLFGSTIGKMVATALVSSLALAAAMSPASATDIAIYKIMTMKLIDDSTNAFAEEIKAKFPDANITFYDAQGQANLFPTIARQIVRSEPDLIGVFGTSILLATVQAAKQADSEVPIVFIATGDPVGAGVANSLEVPGQQSSGTTDWVAPKEILKTLLSALPNVKTIGTVWDSSNQNGKIFHDAFATAVDESGLKLVDVSVGQTGEVFLAAKSLAGRVDAIVLGPDSTIIQSMSAIGGVALENKIPLIATAGDMIPGVLMTLGVEFNQLGKASGEIAVKVLEGAPVGQIPVVGPAGVIATVNQETADALGIELPASFTGNK